MEAAERSDFDRAFSLAREASSSVAKARLLCECAFELGTLASKAEAIAAVRALDESEGEAFLGRRMNQKLLETLAVALTIRRMPTLETSSPFLSIGALGLST